MPSPPPSSDAKPTGNGNSDGADPTPSPVPTIAKRKLRKIPPIPARRGFAARPEKEGEEEEEEDEDEEEEEEEDGRDTGVEDPSSPILPSSLGLNHIRTKSTPPPLHFPSLEPETPKAKDRDGDAGKDPRPVDHASALPLYTSLLMGAGKKSSWIQSKSLKGRFVPHPEIEGHQVTFDIAKGIQSPRFQAILRVTSGRRKRTADIKSFSHELNSKGVRPYPIWKPRGLSHPEEIMVIVSSKFHYLKEEVNSDLAVFAGDLVGILEKIAETHPEWKETLEDLLVEARHCAIMSPTEFWSKCEGIVQKLDDRRQELPTGTLKQLHARILFILTRCTRLIHYYKEGILAAEEHILGFHQLSDLGVYSEQVLGGENQGMKSSINGKDAKEKLTRKPHEQEPFLSDCDTAKSVDSTTSRERISSWKRLPSPAERNQKKKGHIIVDTLTKKTSDKMKVDSLEHTEDLNRPEFPSEVLGNPSDSLSKPQKLRCSYWEDQLNTSDECSIICRICEVEIPTVRVEDHSRVCTIADRCDLKGLSVNQRLLRVAESLEKILHSCTLRSSDAEGIGSPEIAKSSTSSVAESPDGPSPKGNNLSRGCSSDMIDCLPEDDNSSIMDDFKNFPSMSCKTNSPQMPDQLMSSSSSGSITPYCPQSTLTPRTKYINVLLSERHTIIDHEDFQQMKDLVNIAHKIANVNTSSSSEYLLACLEDLQDVVQDRNIDALIVETFGRRIEKLLREKYLQLCDHVDDGKIDSLSITGDEDGLIEEDIVHSLRVSAAISNCKDRTSIEDFEIIKPISRGAFGRVFLAKKRITGDLFAIKVLKKADTIRKNAVESILAERNILMTVHNPFVVRFFFSFTCRENLYLVMEYLNGGDLYSLLRNLGCLEEEMARVYIAEVVLALEYLHSLSIVHRDLKPDNLLIAKNGHIKLTDFGLSQVGLIGSTDDLSGPIVSSSAFLGNEESTLSSEQQMQKREERQKHSAVGTPDYLAPEILLGMGHGTSADWWSVGIILFELLVGIPPFNAEHPQKIFDNIMNRDIPWPNVPEEMSYEAYDLIDKLLSENPMQRLGATGAKEVKQHPFFKDINWDTLARQKATFIPSAEDEQDTSYFMSRYMWNPSDEFVHDDTTETGSGSCCSSSLSNQLNEEDDQCSNLTDFGANTIAAKNYSFSNFSFKNLSQLASINIDLAEKSCRDMPKASKPPIP